jgi:hypothetical protein
VKFEYARGEGLFCFVDRDSREEQVDDYVVAKQLTGDMICSHLEQVQLRCNRLDRIPPAIQGAGHCYFEELELELA